MTMKNNKSKTPSEYGGRKGKSSKRDKYQTNTRNTLSTKEFRKRDW